MSMDSPQLLGDQRTFAPWSIPRERRLQTLGALYYSFITFFFPFINLALPFYLLFYANHYWWLMLLYAIFYLYDRRTPFIGGRSSRFVQDLTVNKWFVDYFPMKLIKTAELDPEHNYLLCYHPHGVISLGALGAFGTTAAGVREQFKGLTIRLATLAANFRLPIRREFLLAYGLIDCGRPSLEYVLDDSRHKGNAVVLVVGGADEALEAHPGTSKLTLHKRKGFIKVALHTGAHLVPVYAFGENEIFVQLENPTGSRVRRFQNAVKHLMGVSPVFFHGRGIFNYKFGFLPFRHPLNVVVGRPIAVQKMVNPSDEQIDALHEQYVQALRELFEQNKDKYATTTDVEFIVD